MVSREKKFRKKNVNEKEIESSKVSFVFDFRCRAQRDRLSADITSPTDSHLLTTLESNPNAPADQVETDLANEQPASARRSFAISKLTPLLLCSVRAHPTRPIQGGDAQQRCAPCGIMAAVRQETCSGNQDNRA
jgi:hypothetical protein